MIINIQNYNKLPVNNTHESISNSNEQLLEQARNLYISTLNQDQKQAVVELAQINEQSDICLLNEITEQLINKNSYLKAFEILEGHLQLDNSESLLAPFKRSLVTKTFIIDSLVEFYNNQNLPALDSSNIWMECLNQKLSTCPIAYDNQLHNIDSNNFLKLLGFWLDTINENDSTLLEKAQNFSISLVEAKGIQDIMQKVKLHHKETKFTQTLENLNNELFMALRQLQKYGVKSTFIADGSGLPLVDWHIEDPKQWLNNNFDEEDIHLVTQYCSNQAVAFLKGFNHPLANAPPTTTIFKLGSEDVKVSSDYKVIIRNRIETSRPDMIFHLFNDGQLYLSRGASLNWLANELNLKIQYEIIRSRIISLYGDLVVPAYLVDESKEIAESEKQATQAKQLRAKNFFDIILARQRLINQADITELIQQNEKRKRTVNRHGVVGFIRRLPKNHRASQYQRQLCFEDQGIILPEFGETYVRAHSRGGQLEAMETETKVHRGRLRHVAAAIKST